MAAEQQATRRWWQRHGSTAVHEVISDLGDMAVVATLESRGGWRTYRGEALEFVGDKWSAGRLHDQLPSSGMTIHTKAVADILKGMTVLPDDEVLTVEARCRSLIAEHKAAIAELDQQDPALRAMALLLGSCSSIGWGGRVTRKDAEKATRLEAHLRYLRSLLATPQAA